MTIKREKMFLTGMITAFVAVICAIAWNKYLHFGYNGFDLAIYNQAFWNTIHGNLFASSIHPPSYLGDHAEWLMLALVPFYAVIPHPFTLVVLQAMAIALSTVPIWLIAKIKFKNSNIRLLFPFLWLANPIMWNLPLFEFHMIVFAIPTTFLAAYFFLKQHWGLFIFMLALILLTREDMAFVVFGFALLGLLELLHHRERAAASVAISSRLLRYARNDVTKWVIIPIALSIIIFFINQRVIGYFNPDGAYKFLIYYQWLGDTPINIVLNAITHPLKVLLHLLKSNNLEIAVAFLLPLAFLPLVRPRFLLLSVVVAVEYLLTGEGTTPLIIKTQYSAAFLPALMLAGMEGYERLTNSPRSIKFFPKKLLPIFVLVATIHSWFSLGPGLDFIRPLPTALDRSDSLTAAAKIIPRNAPVVSSMDMLTALSSRAQVWPMSYVWIGKKQFGVSDYILPAEPEYLILDQQDFVYFSMVHPYVDWAAKEYRKGGERMRQLIAKGSYGVVFNKDGTAVLKKNVGGSWPFVAKHNTEPIIVNRTDKKIGPLNILGWEQTKTELHLFFSADQLVDKEYLLFLNNKYFPLGNGIYPTTDWQPGETVEVILPINETKYEFRLTAASGGLGLTGVNGLFLKADKDEVESEIIIIEQ